MSRYVDGFVLPVPKKNITAYRRMAQKAGKVWREHREFEVADFPRLGKRMVKSGENFEVYDMSNAKPFGPLDT